jgi:type I restriction enzyme S subunit
LASKVKATTIGSPPSNGSLPKGWSTVSFGDVVRDVNEAERNPLDAGLERFVGLEHIEPQNLHLKQWGMLADGEISFTKRFRKGQVLFGKRRAYQRKVAVAEFDGICSSDILAFEPKGDALIPELLPFIVQSDGFFEHALGTSSGSLSPRTRWSQLHDYVFPLPPKDEQRRIADILWAAEDAIESWDASAECFAALLDAISLDEFSSHPSDTNAISPVDLCESVTVGIVVTPAKWYCSDGVPALRSLNVFPDRFVLDDLVRLTQTGHNEHRKSELSEGDVVIVRTGRPGDAAVVTRDVHGFNAIDLIIARPLPTLDPHFLSRFLNSAAGRRQLRRGTAGTAQQHFNVGEMKHLRIPVRTLNGQAETVARMRAVETKLQDAVKNRECLRRMATILRDTLLCNRSGDHKRVH